MQTCDYTIKTHTHTHTHAHTHTPAHACTNRHKVASDFLMAAARDVGDPSSRDLRKSSKISFRRHSLHSYITIEWNHMPLSHVHCVEKISMQLCCNAVSKLFIIFRIGRVLELWIGFRVTPIVASSAAGHLYTSK